MLRRLREAVPPELACPAAGLNYDDVKNHPDVILAAAEGAVVAWEIVRDQPRSLMAMRYRETRSWQQNIEVSVGKTLEDYLREL